MTFGFCQTLQHICNTQHWDLRNGPLLKSEPFHLWEVLFACEDSYSLKDGLISAVIMLSAGADITFSSKLCTAPKLSFNSIILFRSSHYNGNCFWVDIHRILLSVLSVRIQLIPMMLLYLDTISTSPCSCWDEAKDSWICFLQTFHLKDWDGNPDYSKTFLIIF